MSSDARRHYGLDRNYLIIPDYPLDYYIEKLDFMCGSWLRNRIAHAAAAWS